MLKCGLCKTIDSPHNPMVNTLELVTARGKELSRFNPLKPRSGLVAPNPGPPPGRGSVWSAPLRSASCDDEFRVVARVSACAHNFQRAGGGAQARTRRSFFWQRRATVHDRLHRI